MPRSITQSNSRGDIAIYMAFMIATIMISSAMMVGLILVRQAALTENLIASERAFYAADSAQEELYYQLAIGTDPAHVDGTIEYQDQHGHDSVARYTGDARLVSGIACGETDSRYPDPNGEERHLEFGPPGC